MKRRTMGLGLVTGLVVLAGGLLGSGCSSGGDGNVERGTLSVPLTTEGASGTKYRLRNAIFEITNDSYYGYSSAGEGGAAAGVLSVSSEDDPDATSIAVSVERGYKYVRLLPGWHMEKVDGGDTTTVEATLLSDAGQWVWVNPHSTSWVTYEFGLGGRKLWFNGQLNIELVVHEDPNEIYGGGVAGYASDGVGGWSG